MGQCIKIKSCRVLLDQLNTPGFGQLIQDLKCDPDDTSRANPKVCCAKNVSVQNPIMGREQTGGKVVITDDKSDSLNGKLILYVLSKR